MKRLKKKIFTRLVYIIVLVLFVVKTFSPVSNQGEDITISEQNSPSCSDALENVRVDAPQSSAAGREGSAGFTGVAHPIRSVHSYKDCFPDLQEVQYPAARRWGVRPVENREEAEHRKKELLYVGANPYYVMDAGMRSSIPYLVPRASLLLEHIGRRFLDSLAVKQVPLHTILVTSVLRTEEDVRRLRRHNGNASEQSCHRFGTTFDIAYNRFHTVRPPYDTERREVRNDTLKWVLSEVLRDARAEGRCYVKYEVKQGCFHITVR